MLQGLPASGKSTWAKNFCNKNTNFIRVNRDDIRSMCGKYWVPTREKYITKLEQFAVKEALEMDYSVIIDATNLNPKYSNWITRIAEKYSVKLENMFFDTSVEECILRDKSRENPVGETVIMRMYNQHLKKNKNYETLISHF